MFVKNVIIVLKLLSKGLLNQLVHHVTEEVCKKCSLFFPLTFVRISLEEFLKVPVDLAEILVVLAPVRGIEEYQYRQ
jgi:hypothetical protein